MATISSGRILLVVVDAEAVAGVAVCGRVAHACLAGVRSVVLCTDSCERLRLRDGCCRHVGLLTSTY